MEGEEYRIDFWNFQFLKIFGEVSFMSKKNFVSKKEKEFQSGLIKDIKKRFEGCIVLKNDPNYKQGIPDLLVLYNNKWAALEAKKDKNAKHRPNQDYYISKMDKMSFAKFIYPENKQEVLNELERSFKS